MRFEISRQELESLVQRHNNRTVVDYILKRGETIEWICKLLQTSPTSGVSADPSEVDRRKQHFGSNEQQIPNPPSFMSEVISQFKDTTLAVLIVITIISIALHLMTGEVNGSYLLGQDIILLLLMVGTALYFGFESYQSEAQKAYMSIQSQMMPQVRVLRGGKIQVMETSDVLVGDIAIVGTGERIPADSLVMRSDDLNVDESMFTGESEPQRKEPVQRCDDFNCDRKPHQSYVSPVVLGGSTVVRGEGVLVVIAVGPQTQNGQIQQMLLPEVAQPSQITQQLDSYVNSFSQLSNYLVFLLLVVLVVKIAYQTTSDSWDWNSILLLINNHIRLATVLLLIRSLDSLSSAHSQAVSHCSKQLMQKGLLIKKTSSCEEFGNVEHICMEKTGVLTNNKLQVTTVWNQQQKHQIEGNFKELLTLSLIVNNDASLEKDTRSSTDKALLLYASKHVENLETRRKQYPALNKFLFTAARKKHSTVVNYQQKPTIFVTGASEKVIQGCDRWLNSLNDEIEPITEATQNQFTQTLEAKGQRAERTLAVAYRTLQQSENVNSQNDYYVSKAEKGLILIGIIGLRDNVRPQTLPFIRQSKELGIKVHMTTGDVAITSTVIAQELGLVNKEEHPEMLCGSDFASMFEQQGSEQPDHQARQRLNSLVTKAQLYRARPQDKLKLVQCLQEQDRSVMVVADGTADAIAIKKANVGIALGSGTQISKQAASVVLLNSSSLESLPQAIIQSRSLLFAVKQTALYLTVQGMTALIVCLVCSIWFEKTPFTPLQIVWIQVSLNTFGLGIITGRQSSPGERIPKSEYCVMEQGKVYWFKCLVLVVINISAIGWSVNAINNVIPQLPISSQPSNNLKAFNAFFLIQLTSLLVMRWSWPTLETLGKLLLLLVVHFITLRLTGDYDTLECALSYSQWFIAIVSTGIYTFIMASLIWFTPKYASKSFFKQEPKRSKSQ